MTKKQRHQAYKILLEKVDSYKGWEEGYGLCHLINDILHLKNINSQRRYNRVINHHFPELAAKEGCGWPERNKAGWSKRKTFLRQCIKETIPTKRKST